MNIVTGHGDTVCEWVAQVYGVHVLQQPREAVGIVDDDGVLRGAFVITWRNDSCVELHLYGRSSNDTWKWLFRTLFLGSGVSRIEIRTRRDNRAVKKAAPKFGFRFEGVARHYYGETKHQDDALVYSMTPDICRWIRGQPLQVA